MLKYNIIYNYNNYINVIILFILHKYEMDDMLKHESLNIVCESSKKLNN